MDDLGVPLFSETSICSLTSQQPIQATHLSTIDLPPFVDPEILKILFLKAKNPMKVPDGEPADP